LSPLFCFSKVLAKDIPGFGIYEEQITSGLILFTLILGVLIISKKLKINKD